MRLFRWLSGQDIQENIDGVLAESNRIASLTEDYYRQVLTDVGDSLAKGNTRWATKRVEFVLDQEPFHQGKVR